MRDRAFRLPRARLPLVTGVLILTFTAPSVAQSLGEVAKRTAEEREKDAKGGSKAKTYTDKDVEHAEGVTPQTESSTALPNVSAVTANSPKGSVRASVFGSVYRSAKSIDSATSLGVTYIEFKGRLTSLAADISAAADHQPLSGAEETLLRLYETIRDDYDASSIFWKRKIDFSEDIWKGKIPVAFEEPGRAPDTSLTSIARTFDIPVTDDFTSPPMGQSPQRYKAVPGNAMQYIWSKASEAVSIASELYVALSSTTAPDDNTCAAPVEAPIAATAVCNDGKYSLSQTRSGTCSDHQGVRCWVCPGLLCR